MQFRRCPVAMFLRMESWQASHICDFTQELPKPCLHTHDAAVRLHRSQCQRQMHMQPLFASASHHPSPTRHCIRRHASSSRLCATRSWQDFRRKPARR
ncbi:hypothetical protein VFPFJ_06567 [Purpureocillium lilacinum]|uniref:Uncharacterized protein n=1 Tax=Purpureocillium lilacinum TaxID=33203 RepID=A0A179GTM3_PURLI|nr:hypothetical protein VFPFJ_06567 [Purpureocillium lilacinum]OAQ80489.1 hypothetical protein VFPBJ_06074 [Purpureocillium lilacinum]OAQ88102.1 hypothetical protein VFPFJ_06567 [Purpureocillium lilacinum]